MNRSFDVHISAIRKRIEAFKLNGKKIFVTSSFQTHSIPLLHILSQIEPSIPVFFINTGFLFPESIRFRDEVAELLNLQIINLEPLVPKNLQKDDHGNLYFTSDPDYCCYLNKTQTLEAVLQSMDVWINGIRADQNANRKSMRELENAPFNTVRYHPMLRWNGKMIFEYIRAHHLPSHPLDKQGFHSIGCEPCTRKISEASGERDGRWFGLKKAECGLHTDLVKKGEK